jgi:ribonuclease HI
MLQKQILSGRLGKWAYALMEYDLKYEPLRAKKGQVLADFLVEHHIETRDDVGVIEANSCKVFFDGLVCGQVRGIGCYIILPHGAEYELSIQLEFECTNNQAEYEALLSGVETAIELGAKLVDIFGDLMLIVQQISGESQCLDGKLNEYKEKCVGVLNGLDRFSITHVPREENSRSNTLAQQALGYDVRRGFFRSKQEPMSYTLAITCEDGSTLASKGGVREGDWKHALIKYIKDPNSGHDRKTQRLALKFTMIDGALYRRTVGLLLKCLGEEEAMGEVHEGMCGAHQSAHKMGWALQRLGVYWPTMLQDSFKYYKGCGTCQKFSKIHAMPTSMLHPVIKSWPFRGWGLDFIGEVHLASTKGHQFVLVAIDYFTKWVEAVLLKNMMHREVIDFVLHHIIYRFGIPQTLTTDQGSSFMSHQFKEFIASLKIKLLNSSPYYAQAKGQAEASNKIIIVLIKKKIDEKPRRWHEVLAEAMWAYRTSKHGAIKVTPFELVYGQEVVLPVELNLQVNRVTGQDTLSSEEYRGLMMDHLTEKHLAALRKIEKEKVRVARAS